MKPYFTTLEPFAELFRTGVPTLMYHKLGPRPSRVRLKGLYVSRRLFEQQLSELRTANFNTGPYGLPAAATRNPNRQILLTFDDGFENVFRHGLEPLARHGFRAIEFLVADLLGGVNDWEMREGEAQERLMDVARVKEWLAAGHEIGSHTLTHPFLARISRAQAREEISASKKKLEDIFGLPIRHFCYPYGNFNSEVRDLVLEAGYETACTTEYGINLSTSPPAELNRILARYQSTSFKSIQARLKKWRVKLRG